jgi:hypothetical protein
MKQVWIIVAGLLLSLNAPAQAQKAKKAHAVKEPEHVCAMTKNGKLVVTHNGRNIRKETKLPNGSTVFSDGLVKRKDGSYYSLKEGECINPKGEIEFKQPWEKK